MKLEYMPDGSMGNPLIRLYEFTDTEASLLLANVSELAQGSKISMTLNDLDFITPMNDCTLLDLPPYNSTRLQVRILGNKPYE